MRGGGHLHVRHMACTQVHTTFSAARQGTRVICELTPTQGKTRDKSDQRADSDTRQTADLALSSAVRFPDACSHPHDPHCVFLRPEKRKWCQDPMICVTKSELTPWMQRQAKSTVICLPQLDTRTVRSSSCCTKLAALSSPACHVV